MTDDVPAEPPTTTSAADAGSAVTGPSERDGRRATLDAAEPRNLLSLAAFQILLRIGWIFKTETVIMPDFLDAIAGAGWIRGFLPVLNRAGQSVPPLCLAEAVQRSRSKTRLLLWIAVLMAVPFLVLGGVWAVLEEQRQPWLPPLFLALYFIFFSLNGLNQLTFGTAQGKLIRPTRRGRLLGLAGVLGSFGAVGAALWLLPGWLRMPDNAGYTPIFLFNGVMYAVAGLSLLWCREPHDPRQPFVRPALWEPLRTSWRLYRDDAQFRRAARVSMCFISSLLLFPHYQWLGRERLGTTSGDLLTWVVAQNVSLGTISPLLGRVADRRGNRLAVRISISLVAITPLMAVLLANQTLVDGRSWYWVTFALLGMCPLTVRALQNYTLELADESQHSLYLSTMTICMAAPFVFSPLVGWLVDALPYQWTFCAVSAVIAVGGLLTFRMPEPRHDVRDQRPENRSQRSEGRGQGTDF